MPRGRPPGVLGRKSDPPPNDDVITLTIKDLMTAMSLDFKYEAGVSQGYAKQITQLVRELEGEEGDGAHCVDIAMALLVSASHYIKHRFNIEDSPPTEISENLEELE